MRSSVEGGRRLVKGGGNGYGGQESCDDEKSRRKTKKACSCVRLKMEIPEELSGAEGPLTVSAVQRWAEDKRVVGTASIRGCS